MYESRIVKQEEEFPFAFLSDDDRGISIYLNISYDSGPFCVVGTMSFEDIKAYLQGKVYVREDGGVQVADTKVAMVEDTEDGESSVEAIKKASEFIPEFIRELKRGFTVFAPTLKEAIEADDTFDYQHPDIENYKKKFSERVGRFINSPLFTGSTERPQAELRGWGVFWAMGDPYTESKPYAALKDAGDRTVSEISIDRSTGKFALRASYYPDGENLKMSALIFPNENGDVKLDELYLTVKMPGHYDTRFKEFLNQVKSGIRVYAGTVYKALAKNPEEILGEYDTSDDHKIIAKWLRRNACLEEAKDYAISDCIKAIRKSQKNEDVEDLLKKIEETIQAFCWSMTKARLRLPESSEKQLVFDVDLEYEDWDGNIIPESLVVTAKPKFDGVDVEVKGTRDDILKGDVKSIFFHALTY